LSSLIVEICKVEESTKHPNADKLSIIRVKGWNCITGLDQYKKDDLVVFCPPDCIIPNNLIEKYNLEYLKKNGKTGNVRLRGFLSQGLILDVPEGNWNEGDDVSAVLGITKWTPPEAPTMQGVKSTSKKKINPFFDKYTDIENVKNYNDVFCEDDVVVITEKLHGCNARYSRLPVAVNDNANIFEKFSFWFKKYILKQKYEFVYGSHNVQITSHSNRNSFYGEDVWGKIAKKYDLANKIPNDTIVYGEIVGEGIQDLTYGRKNHELFVFDIKVNGKYLDWNDVDEFCLKNDLPVVPELYIGEFRNYLLDHFTNGKSSVCPNQIKEGCVIKMAHEENHPRIGRKILKSVSPDYLLRKNATEYT
jgi:RNA ligase (TIGR02306 family)